MLARQQSSQSRSVKRYAETMKDVESTLNGEHSIKKAHLASSRPTSSLAQDSEHVKLKSLSSVQPKTSADIFRTSDTELSDEDFELNL